MTAPEHGPPLEAVAIAQLPMRYEAAKTALDECDRIDECRDWADRAAALAHRERSANEKHSEELNPMDGEPTNPGGLQLVMPGRGLPSKRLDAKTAQAKLDAIVQYAAKVQDWPLLVEAVDAKIEDQREFVQWWDDAVHRKGGERWLDSAERGYQGVAVTDLEAHTEITHQQVSRWRKSLRDAAKYRERLILAARRKADLAAAANHRAEGSGENEWFTPPDYIAAARAVMGEIDLDPATHLVAQETVQAINHFTRADDGLAQPWHGRVWLNPPYAQPFIAQFIEKLVTEVAARRVQQAILLTHNYTDTGWFHHAEGAADLLCFTRGRIKFVDLDGDDCAPTQGQAFFYYGAEIGRFREHFSRFGFVR